MGSFRFAVLFSKLERRNRRGDTRRKSLRTSQRGRVPTRPSAARQARLDHTGERDRAAARPLSSTPERRLGTKKAQNGICAAGWAGVGFGVVILPVIGWPGMIGGEAAVFGPPAVSVSASAVSATGGLGSQNDVRPYGVSRGAQRLG